jgi:predicted N-acetyltransferase YhbS
MMQVREAGPKDREAVWDVETRAFPTDAEARLVRDLEADPTAAPRISLMASDDGMDVGHVLLTKAVVEGAPGVPCLLLAPLAVIPEFQRRGVGTLLVREALGRARFRGTALVFVLGHPGYYPRAGFVNDAGASGFAAPYPIPPEHADAWRVAELAEGTLGRFRGGVRCADALMKPEYWLE